MSSTLNEDQFPIVPAIGFTLEKLWADRISVLQEARLPFFALLLVTMGDIFYRSRLETELPSAAWLLIAALLSLVILAPICIRWQRVVILGEDIREPGPIFPPVTLRYVATQIVIALFGIVAAIIASLPLAAFALVISGGQPNEAIASLLAPIVVIIAFGVTARLYLVLSALAVSDESLSFREAWQLTQGNGLRLATGLLVIGAVSLIVSLLLTALTGPFLQSSAPMTVQAVSRALGIAQAILFNLILVGYLARAYLHFRGKSAGQDPA